MPTQPRPIFAMESGVNAECSLFYAMASELRYMLAGLRADLAQLDWRASVPEAIAAADQGARGAMSG